jgi:multidrug efflux pump subunit AcrB
VSVICTQIWEKRAFYRRLIRHRLEILILILVTFITVYLFVNFSAFIKSERTRFLVQFLWPGGVSILAVSLLIRIVKDVQEKAGHELYYIIKEEIEKHIYDKAKQTRFLGYLSDKHDDLLSRNKSTRKQALERLIKKFEDEGWPDLE